MSFSYYEVGSYWRPHELEAAKKHLGEVSSDLSKSQILIARTNTETVRDQSLKSCLQLEDKYKSAVKDGVIINSLEYYNFANNKDSCFDIWNSNSIPHPKSKIINSREDLSDMEYPYLLRLNDGVTGEDTYLIEKESDLDVCYPKVESAYKRKKRIGTKIISVQFIDTSTPEGYNLSYRVIAAGNDVICGYARVSDDWLAITKQFTEDKKEAFVRENKKLEQTLSDNSDLIVKAMRLTGHQHVGLDIIPDQQGNIYFLEIQPFYFCGNTSRTKPPYWNPYKPPELIDWLVGDEANLRSEMPIYYDKWLNKHNHFDSCYKSLKEDLLNVRA